MFEAKNLKKIYPVKKGEDVLALKGVSITFPERGMVFILGKSGSGKSTLLHLLGGLDKPTEGEIVLDGKSSKDFRDHDWDEYRNRDVGFVFQEYNLLPEFTVRDNIAIALELQKKKPDKETVERILGRVELQGVSGRKPGELSGGQRQRVAIARALVKEPKIIFADEPTGALDAATGESVLQLLKSLSAEKLVIVVSHDREFAEKFGDRVIEIADGTIVSDSAQTPSEGGSAEDVPSGLEESEEA